jgi:integrase
VSKTLYMVFRQNRWLYNRRVPAELIPVLGYTAVRRSLKTADRALAMKRRSAVDAEVENIFEDARKKLASGSLSSPKKKAGSSVAAGTISADREMPLEIITEKVAEDVKRRVTKAFAEFVNDPPVDAEEKTELLDVLEESVSILRNPFDQRGLEWISATTERILAVTGLVNSPKVDRALAAEIVKRGLLEAQLQKLDRARGDYGTTHHDQLFDPNRPKQMRFGTLCEVFLDEYETHCEKNNVSQKRRDKVRAEATQLREIIGDNLLVQDFDDDAFQRVRKVLAEMPVHRTKQYKNMTLDAAIKRRSTTGAAGLSHLTQQRYLGTLKSIFDVALRKRLITYNPAEKAAPLLLDDLADHERRFPWDRDQIIGFFTGQFYQNCGPNAVEPYEKADRDWRFWIPLLMLFTGARPNEIAQLHADDVQRTAEGGTWHLAIIPSRTGDKKNWKTLKNKASIRRIPLHPEILKIGFLQFVERIKASATDDKRLFPNLKPDYYGNHATYALKRLRDDFIPEEIKLGERQSPYSLRHNFRDQLRRINAPSDTLRAIAGWSPEGKAASSNYGYLFNPDHHIAWVSKVAYDGLDLSFLYVE